MTNYYIAAPWSMRHELRDKVLDLQSRGHYVTSRWITHHPEDYPLNKAAREDFVDVKVADELIYFCNTPEHKSTGGRNVEFGIALADGKRIHVIGPSIGSAGGREHIFHWLIPIYHFYDDWEEFISWLGELGQ